MVYVKSCWQKKSKLLSISALSLICIAEPTLPITTSVTMGVEIKCLNESMRLLHCTSVMKNPLHIQTGTPQKIQPFLSQEGGVHRVAQHK